MSATDNQPDWDKIAEKFDLWLPHIAPVGEALITALEARENNAMLDMASGTGEPALSLAQGNIKGLVITGIDAAAGMARAAQNKVDALGLDNIHFETMDAEHMSFADNSFDRILCRFGVMLFENPQQGLNEMYRVLKPGGRFALAVWSTAETMPTLHWSCQVFAVRVPEEHYPPLIKVTSLGGPDVLDELLYKAGFSDFATERKTFNYEFEDFDAYWDAVEQSGILKQQYDVLTDCDKSTIRDEVGQFAREFIVNGKLVIPHEYILAYGKA